MCKKKKNVFFYYYCFKNKSIESTFYIICHRENVCRFTVWWVGFFCRQLLRINPKLFTGYIFRCFNFWSTSSISCFSTDFYFYCDVTTTRTFIIFSHKCPTKKQKLYLPYLITHIWKKTHAYTKNWIIKAAKHLQHLYRNRYYQQYDMYVFYKNTLCASIYSTIWKRYRNVFISVFPFIHDAYGIKPK